MCTLDECPLQIVTWAFAHKKDSLNPSVGRGTFETNLEESFPPPQTLASANSYTFQECGGREKKNWNKLRSNTHLRRKRSTHSPLSISTVAAARKVNEEDLNYLCRNIKEVLNPRRCQKNVYC